MDPSLFRMLQSIKAIESYIQCETTIDRSTIDPLDYASFKPMYPNVIVVDQSIVDRDLTRKLVVQDYETGLPYVVFYEGTKENQKIVTNTLTGALALVHNSSETRCSIILKEGLYIDPRFYLLPRSQPISLEIVGMKDARILFAHNRREFKFRHVELTLRNVKIFDCRWDRSKNADPWNAGYSDFTVSVGAEIRAINCVFSGCRIWISKETTFRADGSKFIEFPGFAMMKECKCVIADCHFNEGQSRRANTDYFSVLFNAHIGSTVVCDRSVVCAYSVVFIATGLQSGVTFDRCLLWATSYIGGLSENADARITQSLLGASFLLRIKLNVKGKIELKENQLSTRTRPIFLIDKNSKKPSHDIGHAMFDLSNKSCGSCSKEEDTESQYCVPPSSEADPPEKFRYCPCQGVSYCSKECQIEDWPKHRRSCAKRRFRTDSTPKK